jgi:peptidoglycan/xylan/chitin deacetylase (PgdA/CDA1 family)
LQSLQNAGWEIVSHSQSHNDLTKMSASRLTRELSGSKTTLQNHGLNVNNFALPYGAYNDNIMAQAAKYYRSARAYEQGFNALGTYPFDVKVKGLLVTTTPAEVAAWLNEAKTRGQWVVLVFHTLADTGDDAYHTTPAAFREMVKEVADSGLQVVTYNQGLDAFEISN